MAGYRPLATGNAPRGLSLPRTGAVSLDIPRLTGGLVGDLARFSDRKRRRATMTAGVTTKNDREPWYPGDQRDRN
jgi:hypothetical protein